MVARFPIRQVLIWPPVGMQNGLGRQGQEKYRFVKDELNEITTFGFPGDVQVGAWRTILSIADAEGVGLQPNLSPLRFPYALWFVDNFLLAFHRAYSLLQITIYGSQHMLYGP